MSIGRIGARNVDTFVEVFRFNASGGETSLSGTDAGGRTLVYPLNYEAVFLNGVRLVRGVDYTASTGTSITGLTALTSGDVVEIVVYQSIDLVSVDFADVRLSADAPSNPSNGTIWIESDVTVNTADFIAPTIVDAKGDLITASAADSVTRLPVGGNGQALLADSTQTTGLRWGSVTSSGEDDQIVLAVQVFG